MKGDGSSSGMVSSTVQLLHNKVDKMIRLMVETSEGQKKMNKVLGDLVRNNGFTKQTNLKNGEEEDSKKKKKKDKERDKSRERDRKSPDRDSVNRSRSSERSSVQQPAPPPQVQLLQRGLKPNITKKNHPID